MKISRIIFVENQIRQFFSGVSCSAFSEDELYQILKECRKPPIKLPKYLSLKSFIGSLTETKILQPHYIEIPILEKTHLRYTCGEFTLLELCASIHRKSYFTHGTALYIHGLTSMEPNKIYINSEQSAKSNTGTAMLSQDGIDIAFSRPQRETTRIGSIRNLPQGKEIVMLNGKQTKNLGVIEIDTPFGKRLPVTNLERTLIDIVVRPTYSGGLLQIINAYRLAKNKFSIKILITILKKISHAYPYHQAIGFLLEKTGEYDKTDLDLLKELGLEYNFYLDRRMTNPAYSKEWRLYYPKEVLEA